MVVLLIRIILYNTCTNIFSIYYQNSDILLVPEQCRSLFADDSVFGKQSFTAQALYVCPELASLAKTFVRTTCTASFSKICTASYTDNPPFSCTNEMHPEILTVLGTIYFIIQSICFECFQTYSFFGLFVCLFVF
jgi:hypothetical protein